MQKFVVIKRTQKPSSVVDIIETQVRMSGYLKKKRNRVGGWRKQWFVLQNQLLLSYSSRGDYEKKLVPFKDVINLVPGSVVRPSSGSRFTIETTSNAIYTFRCIDSKTCAEWIMALLESLSLVAQTVIDKNLSFVMQNKDYQKMFATSSRSCESLALATRPTSRTTGIVGGGGGLCGKYARLPIANGTKRLVERGCIDDSNYVKLGKDGTTDIGVQNFRLHQSALLKENQSKEVSRINRMFHSCKEDIIHNNELIINNNKKKSIDLNKNKMDGQIYSNIEEQIQQMTLDEETEGENNVSRKKFKITKKKQNIETSHLNKNESDYNNDDDDDEDDDNIVDNDIIDDNDEMNIFKRYGDIVNIKKNEAIYAVVDLKDKHARRAKLREMERERPKSFHVISNDYEEVNNISTDLFVKSIDGENIYEPVNVSGGHTNRNIIWRYFPKINFDSFIEFTRIGGGHGREQSQQQHQHNNKITNKLKIKEIIKDDLDNDNDNTTSSFADMKRKLGNHRRSIKDKMKKFYSRDERRHCQLLNETDQQIHHQQQQSQQELQKYNNKKSPSGSISQNSNISSDREQLSFQSQPADNNSEERPIKRDRNIFGSLPRMRKSRTSPCLEDLMKTKKNKILKKKNNSDDFQIELKKELTKRTVHF